MKKVVLPMLAAAAFMAACDCDCDNVDVSYAPGTPGDFQRNIKDRVFFGFDSSKIAKEATSTVESQAAWFKTHSAATATVEGRTDERGTSEYNRALGARRAEAVKNALVNSGVNGGNIKIVSFGKDKPVVPNAKTEREHVQNRTATTVVN